LQEFRRYFDIGVFHWQQSSVREQFGQVEAEGRRYVLSELAYLWPRFCYLYLSVLLRTMLKYAGYKLGLYQQFLPMRLKKMLSMNPVFWSKG
ncbi:MAG: hypothetical protein OET90_12150, partial [Desulfuromonadales bacterium]|nr:hypothetical protein [Desulfuromonadales bacterium]